MNKYVNCSDCSHNTNKLVTICLTIYQFNNMLIVYQSNNNIINQNNNVKFNDKMYILYRFQFLP